MQTKAQRQKIYRSLKAKAPLIFQKTILKNIHEIDAKLSTLRIQFKAIKDLAEKEKRELTIDETYRMNAIEEEAKELKEERDVYNV